MAEDPDFPCLLVIDIPFPTARLATIALQVLSVDKELSPSVRRSFSVHGAGRSALEDATTDDASGADTATVLRTTYEASTNRMLRVSVNAFFDSVGLVTEVMEGMDEDVLASEADP
ncbi:hypothetical protein SEPCBS57363_005205 [Sporothrix epigloea]|uniref:Pcc1-domain-containing protein n=1 Tax=Sporothrix epigloea TaxID=1892477 RepID=A0ABP0DWA1_9PEZI